MNYEDMMPVVPHIKIRSTIAKMFEQAESACHDVQDFQSRFETLWDRQGLPMDVRPNDDWKAGWIEGHATAFQVALDAIDQIIKSSPPW